VFLAEAAAELASLSPSVLANLGGWLAVGASVIVSVSKGWLIPKGEHDKQLAAKDKAFAEMVALKDKAFADALLVRKEQLDDMRNEKNDWRTSAVAADARADLLASNQAELMDGLRTSVRFIEAVHRATGGPG
jgi:hypothetical protein